MTTGIIEGFASEVLTTDLGSQLEQICLRLEKLVDDEVVSPAVLERFAEIAMLMNDLPEISEESDNQARIKAQEEIAKRFDAFLDECKDAIPQDFCELVENLVAQLRGGAKLLEASQYFAGSPQKNSNLIDLHFKGLEKIAEAIEVWKEIPIDDVKTLYFLTKEVMNSASNFKPEDQRTANTRNLVKYIAGYILWMLDQEKLKKDPSNWANKFKRIRESKSSSSLVEVESTALKQLRQYWKEVTSEDSSVSALRDDQGL